MQESDIAWTTLTWNPSHGCSKVSAGCDNCYAERIDLLRGCDAETLFISFEPLIGPVGDIDLTGIDWVIVGGESGPDEDRREMDHEWACEIFRECRHDGDIHREPTEDDVAFFFKQSSARQPERGTELTIYNDERGHYVQRKIREMPEPSEVVVKAREAVPA